MPKQNQAKPFVKWVGGKGQLLATLETLLPADIENCERLTYVEPFVGGGAMLFFMLQRFKKNIGSAVINDINSNLVLAYRVVKNNPDQLVQNLEKLQTFYYSIPDEESRRAFYLQTRQKFNDGGLSDVDNTMYFFFLNRTCFNGLYRVNSKGNFNVPFGKYSQPTICDAATIYADSELLQNVEISSGDFEQMEKYVTANTFVYFDPPYRPLDATSNFNSYAKEAFNDAEQIRLKNFFAALSQKGAKLMLSNSDCKGRNPEDDFFDELYKDFIIERVYASRFVNANAAKRGKLTELLIRNYPATRRDALLTENRNFTHNLNSTFYDESTYRRTV